VFIDRSTRPAARRGGRRAYDGGAGEVGHVIPAMRALQRLAGTQPMLMIGDSKLRTSIFERYTVRGAAIATATVSCHLRRKEDRARGAGRFEAVLR
jgi:hypothetical protein